MPIIRFKRALTRLEEKNFTNAYKDLSLVLLLNPLHQQAYYYRAITYKYCGAYTHAISDLNQAQELAFENSLLYLQRGICYKFIGNFKFAIADLDKAQELDPENSIIYYERGLTYKKMAQYKPAIKDLKRVLKINPENSLAMLKLGSIYSKNSKSTLAIKAMDTIIEANPETYQAYKIRGINLYLQEKIEDAIKDLTKSLQLKPDYRDAAIRLEHILNNLTSTNVEKINKFIIQIAIFKLPETMQIPLLKKCLDKTTILGQYFAKFKKSENNNSAINTLNQKKTEKEDMDRVIDSIIASIKQINFDDSATDSISQMISRLKLIDPKFKLSEIAPTVKNIFENNSQLQNASSELTSTPNNAAFKL